MRKRMSVKIYIQRDNGPIHVGTFKDQQAAETYWNRSKEIYRDKHGYMPEPIYINDKKVRKHYGK